MDESQYFDMISDLKKAAKEAREKAYAPYSNFKVGAAVYADNNKIYSGCNVENAVYGGAICAERVAITKAVSDGAQVIGAVLVFADTEDPCPPCGICRQFISEFAEKNTVVFSLNEKGKINQTLISELLPNAFKSSHMKD